MKRIVIAGPLEKALLRAVIEGISPTSVVQTSELSKEGQQVLEACEYLLSNGAVAPLKPSAVLLAAVTKGADKDTLRDYLASFKEVEIENDVKAISKAARHKELLVSLINEAGSQLSVGKLDAFKLLSLLEKSNDPERGIVALCDMVGDTFAPKPHGIPLSSLPKITKATHGLDGVWILGGEPGLGKSTLAWQMSIELGQQMPVLYYDLDGTGSHWLIERTRRIAEDDITKYKEITKQVYIRDNIRELEADIMTIKPPALIVIDSVQTLPTTINHRRSSLDKWIVDFKNISKKGYPMVLVSEIARGSYGEVKMGGYKETGELEYAGSVCCQLTGDIEDDEVEFHIVKNRHGPKRGLITTLKRDSDKVWWWKES